MYLNFCSHHVKRYIFSGSFECYVTNYTGRAIIRIIKVRIRGKRIDGNMSETHSQDRVRMCLKKRKNFMTRVPSLL